MNPKFQASVQSREDVTFVKLAGVIDEDNELNALADKLSGGTAVIDLAEIDRINSCGVRDWVNWLGRAERKGAQVVLVECSPAIVAQINLVNNFTGQGVVKSFFAPYFCPTCDREKALLVETRDVAGNTPFRAPTCRCDECDGPMDFDDMEESYFAFLANNKKIVTDSRVDQVINEYTPTDGDRKLRVRTNPGQKVGTPTGQSLPSIPSLPLTSTSRPGSQVSMTPMTNGGAGSSNPGLRPSTAQALAELEARRSQSQAAPMPSKSNLGWIIVSVLVFAAIGAVAFVLFFKH